MGIWQSLRNAKRKGFTSGGWDGRQPDIWSVNHPLSTFVGSNYADRECIANDFEDYVQNAFKQDGAVFALITARQFVFSEVTFRFRRKDFATGRPADLFGGASLSLLERPWPGGTTGELLGHMEQDASLAGNSWWTVADDNGKLGNSATGPGRRLVRMRPDWVEMVIGTGDPKREDPFALDAKVLAILYKPQQKGMLVDTSYQTLSKPVMLLPEEVCHYSPIPDPTARFRGMSWITPILVEAAADIASTRHKKAFLDNAAVPNLAVKFDKETSEDTFDEFVETFKEKYQGSWNAYKTLFLMGGADVVPLTHDFRQMEFNQTQGKGESRIAAAAGVPSSWVGFSEGLQGSSLNSGNFSAARRRFADGTIRPLWRMAAASLEVLVPPPDNEAQLWFDERDVAFLREDAMDQAEIMRVDMNAIDAAIKAGFKADASVQAIINRDIGQLLGNHTGLTSVQMQPSVDPASNLHEEQGAADVTQVQAAAIASLSVLFTPESVVLAVTSGDLSKLVKRPDPPPEPAAPDPNKPKPAPNEGGKPNGQEGSG